MRLGARRAHQADESPPGWPVVGDDVGVLQGQAEGLQVLRDDILPAGSGDDPRASPSGSRRIEVQLDLSWVVGGVALDMPEPA